MLVSCQLLGFEFQVHRRKGENDRWISMDDADEAKKPYRLSLKAGEGWGTSLASGMDPRIEKLTTSH